MVTVAFIRCFSCFSWFSYCRGNCICAGQGNTIVSHFVVQRGVFTVAIACVPCGPRRSLIYAWAWGFCVKEFHPMATAKEWDDTSPPCRAGVFFPGIPTYLARIMHRLHVGVWRCMCVPTKCECGMSVSFHHVMFSCTSCSDHFQPLTGKLRSVGLPLCTKSLAVCDQREGWSLLRAAARLVYTCPLAAYL